MAGNRDNYKTEIIHFTSIDGTRLVGDYVFPADVEVKGAAILLHGIPSSRNEGGFYTRIAEGFASKGIASFRFDFRYMGESESGREQDMTLENWAEDIESAFCILKKKVKNVPFFGVGTSCGGGVLLKWIQDYNRADDISRLFFCCPVTDYFYEATGYRREDAVSAIDFIENQLNSFGYVSGRDAKYARGFCEDALLFDVDEACQNYNKPIFVYHGDLDKNVPIELAIDFSKNENVDLIVIENAGHGFGLSSEYVAENDLSDEFRIETLLKRQNEIMNDIIAKIIE